MNFLFAHMISFYIVFLYNVIAYWQNHCFSFDIQSSCRQNIQFVRMESPIFCVCGHFSIILYAHRRIGNRGFGKIIIHAQKVFIFSVQIRPHSVLSRFCYQRETYVSLHVTISERDFCLGKQMPHYRFILVIELLGNT